MCTLIKNDAPVWLVSHITYLLFKLRIDCKFLINKKSHVIPRTFLESITIFSYILTHSMF